MSILRIPSNRTATSNPWLLAVLFLLAAISLGACAGVLDSDKPAREVYLLNPPKQIDPANLAEAPNLMLSLLIVPGLDTDDIQVLGSNARLNPVANAHWAENLPEVMTSLARRTLIDSKAFHRVTVGSIARPGDWNLELEVQAFYGLQDNSGSINSVLVQMEASLNCAGISAVLPFESRKSLRSDSLADLVAGHQRALDDILQTLPASIVSACVTAQ